LREDWRLSTGCFCGPGVGSPQPNDHPGVAGLAATTTRGADRGARRAVRIFDFGFVISGSGGFACASASSAGSSRGAAATGAAVATVFGADAAMNGSIAVSNSIFCGHLCSERMRSVVLSISAAWFGSGGGDGTYQFAAASIARSMPATTTKYRTRGTDPALSLTAALHADKRGAATGFQSFRRRRAIKGRGVPAASEQRHAPAVANGRKRG